MTDLHPFIAGLPKAELHVHHVGSASPRIVAELAARHPDSKVPTDPEALADYFTFTDFAHFIEVYLSVVDLIRTPEDVRLLTFEVARDMARQNIRYAELTITPFSSTRRGIDEKAFMAAIEDARKAAEAELGVVLRWCFDIPGEAGLEAAEETARLAVDLRPEGLVSFGLGGPEIGVPRPQFKPYFDRAIAAGLHSVPHAGETTGPQTIWDALNELRAERIGHGTSATQDPKLLAHLAEHRIAAGGLPDLEHRHPRRRRPRRAPDQGDGRGRCAGDDQQRRPADVRHRPQQRVRGRRPAAGAGRARARRPRQERRGGVLPRPGGQGADRGRDRHVHRCLARAADPSADNGPMRTVSVVGHRGDPYRVRENTLPSLRSAIERGADAVEIDVRLTRDGVPVLLHDASLKRLWGHDRPLAAAHPRRGARS